MTKVEIRREEARKLNTEYRRKLWIKVYVKKYFETTHSGTLRKELAKEAANEALTAFNDKFVQKKIEEPLTNILNEGSADTTISVSHVDVH